MTIPCLGDMRHPEMQIRGDRYRLTHRASVVGILGTNAPVVCSRGNRFYNKDRWTVRFFTRAMCDWAKANPGCGPTLDDIAAWVKAANELDIGRPEIVIAQTPDKLPLRTALGLTGGAYHEALHTYYSCRRDLTTDEMAALVLPRWARVPDWSKYLGALLYWGNLIEDIRIERRGCEQFAEIGPKLWDLQDLILVREKEGQEDLRTDVIKPGALSIVSATFRDIGLGYDTMIQREALSRYRVENARAFDLVVKGPLTPFLKETVALKEKEDTVHLRIALDILVRLVELGGDWADGLKAADGRPGDGKIACPRCGAGPDKLIVRPKSDGNGGRVPDKGIVTCIICGGQDEVDIRPAICAPGGVMAETLGIRFEGFDDKPAGPGVPSGGGGHHHDPDPHPGNTEWTDVVVDALHQAEIEGDGGLQDAASALAAAVAVARNRELGEVFDGETSWRPYDIGLDEVLIVGPSARGRDYDSGVADQIVASVREETAYLRSRLRSLILGSVHRGQVHGVPKGNDLSDRYLVDTLVALMAGENPRRAYQRKGIRIDLTLAGVVVIDESGSMENKLRDVSRVFVALTEPLDALRCPTLALGVRDGRDTDNFTRLEIPEGETAGDYHRFPGVIYDVFKGWNERFRSIQWRFANTRAVGGTPLSDGIQYGLIALSGRKEHHRFLFVVTDGQPNRSHVSVINRQVRQAKATGVHIVGVGLGSDATYVRDLFPDYVWAEQVPQIPKLLVAKLNDLVDARAGRLVGGRP